MKNDDESVETSHNPNWRYIPDQTYRILTIGGSGSGKTNVLVNLINHQQPDIIKIYLYVKDSLKSKYQLLINEREKVGTHNLKSSNTLINYSRIFVDVYENLED